MNELLGSWRRAEPDLSVRFVSSDYWLGPGPMRFEEPYYSFEVHEIAEYRPESIAASIRCAPPLILMIRSRKSLLSLCSRR
jgi:hypothetical protein